MVTAELQHLGLALVLTGLLAGQAGALAAVLRSRRMLAASRQPRITELAWVTIPLAVVFFLAARSWIIALDPGSPPIAVVMGADVSGGPVPPPISYP